MIWEQQRKSVHRKKSFRVKRNVDVHTEVKLINKFNLLKEKDASESVVKKEKENQYMFTVGSKNIFKIRRTRVFFKFNKTRSLEAVKSSSNFDEMSKPNRKRNKLSCFQTLNRFQMLTDNPEDEMDKLMKRLDCVVANKKSLKRCRTCHFKKRQCILNPNLCTAINHVCSHCKKPGHFPKSLCCKKKRKAQSKLFAKMKNKNIPAPKLSKKHQKLINQRIKELESENERINIFKLAEKCANRFENKRFYQGHLKLINYCTKKLKKLLNIKSVPNEGSVGTQ